MDSPYRPWLYSLYTYHVQVNAYISKDYKEVTDTSTQVRFIIQVKEYYFNQNLLFHIPTVVIIIIAHDLIDGNLKSVKKKLNKIISIPDGASN